MSGCSPPLEDPKLAARWQVELDPKSSVIAVGDEYVYVRSTQEAATDILALRIRDGSFAWSTLASGFDSAYLDDDELVITQKVGDTTLISALSAQTGEEVWVRPFEIQVLAVDGQGSFLLAEKNRLTRSGLGGVQFGDEWITSKGCTITAANQTGSYIYVSTQCEDKALFDILDENFNAIEHTEIVGENTAYTSSKSYGEYVVLFAGGTEEVTIFVGGQEVFRGADLGSSTFHAIDRYLRITTSGSAPLTLDVTGNVVVPPDPNARYLTYSSSYTVEATEFSFRDPSTGATDSRIVARGTVSALIPSRSGTSYIAAVRLGSRTIIEFLEITREPKQEPDAPLSIQDFIASDATLPSFTVADTTSTKSSEWRDFRLTATDGGILASGSAIRMESEADAEATLTDAQSTDASASYIYARQGRCVGWLYVDGADELQLKALSEAIFGSIVSEGCNG